MVHSQLSTCSSGKRIGRNAKERGSRGHLRHLGCGENVSELSLGGSVGV